MGKNPESENDNVLYYIIVIIPLLAYIPQYIENAQKNNPGFSHTASFLTMMSACMKIALWVNEPYDAGLLLQNFASMLALFFLIDQSIKIENRRTLTHFTSRNFVDWDFSQFWNWTNIISYVQATALFLILLSFFAYHVSLVGKIIMLIQIISMIVDIIATVPQMFENYNKRTTHGLNKAMISMWFLSDGLKIFYIFVLQHSAPWPMMVSLFFQFGSDMILIGQTFYYGDRAPRLSISN